MRAPEVGQDGASRRGRTDAELAEIEAELWRARARVAASVHALGEEVSRRTDWRAWVAERPGWTLGAALALGFLLGNLGGGPTAVRKGREFRWL
jgi:ElaB/YqjD/DUF883 family membrane-anchored ribosome-binding protein